MSSGVSVNKPCVCLGDREREPSSDTSSLGNKGTGGIYALWNALVQRDSPASVGSTANETGQVRVSTAKETRNTRSVEEIAAGFRRPTPGRSCDMLHVDLSLHYRHPQHWLEGRMAPKEEELRLPPLETAIELLMVDMRLPAASLHRFRFSLPFARCILYHGVTHRQMNKDGMRTPGCFV